IASLGGAEGDGSPLRSQTSCPPANPCGHSSGAARGRAAQTGGTKRPPSERYGRGDGQRRTVGSFRQPGGPGGTHGVASHPCGWFAFLEEPGHRCPPGDEPSAAAPLGEGPSTTPNLDQEWAFVKAELHCSQATSRKTTKGVATRSGGVGT